MKVLFESLSLLVLKMEERGYGLTHTLEVDAHFKEIMELIESCGWSLDDYTDRLMGWTDERQSLN